MFKFMIQYILFLIFAKEKKKTVKKQSNAGRCMMTFGYSKPCTPPKNGVKGVEIIVPFNKE